MIGQERLLELAQTERMPHGVLLAGATGAGKRGLARRLAAVWCLGEDAPERLSGCPGYREFGDAAAIPVSDVRELIASTAMQGFNGGKRAYVLLDAHTMNPQAQNALLKTLEEPPADTILILTGNEMGFLPTIRSRCAIFRFGAGEPDRVAETLTAAGVDADTARLAGMLADGVPGLAALYATENYCAFRAAALDVLEQALFESSPFAEAAKLLSFEIDPPQESDTKNKRELRAAEWVIRTWTSALRDALVTQTGGAEIKNRDCLPLISRIAERFTTTQIQGIIREMTGSAAKLRFGASAAQTLDALLAGLYGKEKQTAWQR